jgi:hypothetical protein
MTQFVHPFWSTVGRNYASLEASAPDGYSPEVEVHLVDDPAPIPVCIVESRRDYSWVLLHSRVEGKDDAHNAYPSDRYIFVEQSRVARVEIRYVRETELAMGFTARSTIERAPDASTQVTKAVEPPTLTTNIGA